MSGYNFTLGKNLCEVNLMDILKFTHKKIRHKIMRIQEKFRVRIKLLDYIPCQRAREYFAVNLFLDYKNMILDLKLASNIETHSLCCLTVYYREKLRDWKRTLNKEII